MRWGIPRHELRPMLAVALALCGLAEDQVEGAVPMQDDGRMIIRKAEPAVEWKLALKGPGVNGPRVIGAVEVTPAPVEVDEELARAALARLEARATMLLEDLERATGATAARTDPLAGVLQRGVLVAHETGMAKRVTFDIGWLDAQWSAILSSSDWRGAVREHLSDEMREALSEHRGRREDRTLAAREQVALVALASELRLRDPQVAELAARISVWMDSRIATSAQMDAGDIVGEMLLSPAICDALLDEQVGRLRRMRSAARAAVPRDEGPGDDLLLGRGRYPEDDFVLEGCALAQANGWLWEDAELLQHAATMLGREHRRSARSSWKHGDRDLVAPIVDFTNEPLWRAVIAREAELRGVEGDFSGPLFTGDRDAHVNARVDMVLALLDERLLLSAAQLASLRAPVAATVAREFDRRSPSFGAVDGRPVWRALRIEGDLGKRRGASPREEFVAGLRDALEVTQLAELGL